MEELKKELAFYKQREQELRLRVEELKDFIENASLPIHWVDSEGSIIWANQAELDLLGYSKEEYIGHPISKFHADQAARLEEGKIYLNKGPFSLHPLMEDIANDAQLLAAGHKINLKDCEDIVVNADKDKISQILINLLSNAIKYDRSKALI